MKEKARALLKEIYGRYLSSGENGIYFYGSILRDDFNPQTSDIDTVAIVGDEVPLEVEKQIQNELVKSLPEAKKFGFRLLYISELKGEKIKSFVASVISPKALLLDLPNWEYVVGKKFMLKDFPARNFDEPIVDELALIKRRKWDKVADIPEKEQEYFIKKLIQLLYLMDQAAHGPKPFSYDILRNIKEPIAAALLECKASKYDKTVFKKNVPEFQKFVDQIIK